MSDDLGWQLGTLDRLRALMRRVLIKTFGSRGEDRLHQGYHRFLRRTGHFRPPEDAATIGLLSGIAHRSGTTIDVGANVGRYAWFMWQHARPGSQMFAIEPHPGSAKLLRRAFAGVPGCSVLEVGAAERDTSGELIIPTGAFGSPVSGLAWVASKTEGPATGSIQVRLRRLDGLVDQGAISVVGPLFIKIDVEGGEAGVLRGASELLRLHRPILYFECQAASLARQGETPEDVWAELGRAGYRMFGNRAGRFVPMDGVETEIVNYLGIPDLTAADAAEPLDATAIDAILDSWAARTRPGGNAEH